MFGYLNFGESCFVILALFIIGGSSFIGYWGDRLGLALRFFVFFYKKHRDEQVPGLVWADEVAKLTPLTSFHKFLVISSVMFIVVGVSWPFLVQVVRFWTKN